MHTQQTQNICITFIQRRPNVFDVGPTLCKCYTNVLCLQGNYKNPSLYRRGLYAEHVGLWRIKSRRTWVTVGDVIPVLYKRRGAGSQISDLSAVPLLASSTEYR